MAVKIKIVLLIFLSRVLDLDISADEILEKNTQVDAGGILKVCKYYFKSPPVHVSDIIANLKNAWREL